MEVGTQNFLSLIDACKNGSRTGQRKLYELYYSYGMSICLRYAAKKDEAQEILNDGFYKVFTKIDQYDSNQPFKQWFRTILINTAIDYHRKFHKFEPFAELNPSDTSNRVANEGLENLLYEELMESVQQLPPQYRLVFNLFAVDELTHQEIAQQLNISVGTSKSNYSKARRKLQGILMLNGHLKPYLHG